MIPSRVADRVVAAQRHREGAAGVHVPDGLVDLVEALLDVARDGEHVAEIADGYALPQVNGELEAVGPIQRRDLPHPLGAEPGTRPVGRARIQRHPEHGHVILTAAPHILQVRRL
jgi:hypothetical protein